MNSTSRSFPAYILFLFSAIALAGLGWANYWYASQNGSGESFLVYWTGTRALITEGTSPYSPAVAEAIRQAYQQRSIETPAPVRLTVPLYFMIFFLPFALFSDEIIAFTIWLVVIEIGLVLFAIACIRLTKWRMNAWNLPLFALFVLTWFHSLIALKTGNAIVLVALLIAWSLLAIRNGLDELAGSLLALATVEPGLVILPVAFVLLWAGFQKRWKLIAWFLGFLVLLLMAGLFFLRDWLLQNIQAVFASLDMLYPMTPRAAFIGWLPGVGDQLGWIFTGLSGLILLFEWWMAIRVKEFRWFLWTLCLTMVLGQWIGLPVDPVNYLLLLLPLTLVFAVWDERWRRSKGRGRTVFATVASLLGLGLGLWAIYWYGANRGLGLHQMPVMLFVFPLFLVITLYWVRWWAIRPQQLYVEVLREQEENPTG